MAPDRPRLGYRASSALAAFVGLAGEAAVRLGHHDLTAVWNAARVPFVALVAVAVAQVPRRHDHPPRTVRPRRSELARHLDRQVRR